MVIRVLINDAICGLSIVSRRLGWTMGTITQNLWSVTKSRHSTIGLYSLRTSVDKCHWSLLAYVVLVYGLMRV